MKQLEFYFSIDNSCGVQTRIYLQIDFADKIDNDGFASTQVHEATNSDMIFLLMLGPARHISLEEKLSYFSFSYKSIYTYPYLFYYYKSCPSQIIYKINNSHTHQLLYNHRNV